MYTIRPMNRREAETVAVFNKRAIKAYEKAGFQAQSKFVRELDGEKTEFI